MPIINSKDQHKILPMSYIWAHTYYKTSSVRQWRSEDFSMQLDIEQWHSLNILTNDERMMVLRTIGYFSTASSFTANNIILTGYRYITNPECRQYLLRQAYELSVHTDAFIYCCDSFGLDPHEIYSMHKTIDTMKAKDDLVAGFVPGTLSLSKTRDLQKFILSLVSSYIVSEGIFFYTGFAMMLMLKRRDKLVELGTLFEHMMQDATVHVAFGCDIIKEICIENPRVWTPAFKEEVTGMIKYAVELEKKDMAQAWPDGLMGLDTEAFYQYIDHIADKRLEQIGLPKIFQQVNPFKWISSYEESNTLFGNEHEYHTTDIDI